MELNKNKKKNEPTASDMLRNTNLNPDDFEMPDREKGPNHSKSPKKK